MAACFTDVVVYRSVQIKGRVVELPGKAGLSDVALFKRYQDQFFAATGQVGTRNFGIDYPATQFVYFAPKQTLEMKGSPVLQEDGPAA